MIENYEFGLLWVDGRQYRRDVIIHPAGGGEGEHVDANWWRKEGHRLDKTDLGEVLALKPAALVVGTGYYGRMEVPKETIDFLEDLGIEVHVGPTKAACRKYNELRGAKQVVAAMHLTC
jgi:hypothetical protein